MVERVSPWGRASPPQVLDNEMATKRYGLQHHRAGGLAEASPEAQLLFFC